MGKSIVLIGYMGAGKTTLGKALASNLGRDFCDLDWYIEARYHKTIADIFAERGEDGFRQIERNMLHEVAEFQDNVIAVGGGTPCFFDNMDYLNANTETVYIKASVNTLIDHIHISNTKRPLLEGKSDAELVGFINDALLKREPYYLKANHILHIETIHLQKEIDAYVEQIKQLTAQ